MTIVAFRTSQWLLWAAAPSDRALASPAPLDAANLGLIPALVGVMRGGEPVRLALPGFLRAIKKRATSLRTARSRWYPRNTSAARTMQGLMRFLLRHLPKLGLLREAWHVLRSAQQMERASRPQGLAVTEYDRLFRDRIEEFARSGERGLSQLAGRPANLLMKN